MVEVAHSVPGFLPQNRPPATASVSEKPDGSYVTSIDEALQTELQRRLSHLAPEFGFIGEEMTHSDQVMVCNTSHSGYWVIDPLDGTTNFTSGFLFYGVSVALVLDGQPRLAVVYDPVRQECFSAALGQGRF